MTAEQLRPCSTPGCHPLCRLCRELGTLTPLVRSTLARRARLYGCRLHREDVEDLTQQVLFELARKGAPPHALRRLAVTVARRRLIDWLQESVARGRCAAVGERIEETPDHRGLSDAALDVIAAMDRMTQEMREVFFACGIEGRSHDEVVEHLGLSLHRVRVLKNQALAIAAEVLRPGYAGEPPRLRAEE